MNKEQMLEELTKLRLEFKREDLRRLVDIVAMLVADSHDLRDCGPHACDNGCNHV